MVIIEFVYPPTLKGEMVQILIGISKDKKRTSTIDITQQ